jgi:hypothetical protein
MRSLPSMTSLRDTIFATLLRAARGEQPLVDARGDDDGSSPASLVRPIEGGGAAGRPFMVDGLARTAPVARRSEWCERAAKATALAPVAPEIRPRLAAAWTNAGCMEHASIAAFARFVLQLLAVGAPPELVADAQRALADEVVHARLAFGLASAYAGVDVGPGKLAVDESLGSCGLRDLVFSVFAEGCVGETIAALEAREACDYASDPAVGAVLRQIAEDETRHAELAWRTVAWIATVAGHDAHGWLDQAIAEEVAQGEWDAPFTVSSRDDVLRKHGVLTEGLRQQLRRAAMAEVIIPCAAAVRTRSTIAA